MAVLQLITFGTKAFKGLLKKGQSDHPLEAMFDKAITMIFTLLIPVEMIADTISSAIQRNKGLILGTLFIIGFMTYASLSSVVNGATDNDPDALYRAWLPQSLQGYLEPGFINSPSPLYSPFGGTLSQYTIVTAYYHDTNYYQVYHRWHEGMDLVPNINYYRENIAYIKYGDTVIFATCSGTATSLRDNNGANYIYLECADNRYAVLMVHNKVNFIPLGEKAQILAGQPVAVMGNTGNSFGAHVHYAIRDLKNGAYLNPANFIDP